jgi:hypothetical protein
MKRTTNMDRLIIRKKKHYSNKAWNVELIQGVLSFYRAYEATEYKADKAVERLQYLYPDASMEVFSP